MVREIVKVSGNKAPIMLIHRYNTRDDTFIEYYYVPSIKTVYKNTWKCTSYTENYEKRVQLTENEKALVKIGA